MLDLLRIYIHVIVLDFEGLSVRNFDTYECFFEDFLIKCLLNEEF